MSFFAILGAFLLSIALGSMRLSPSAFFGGLFGRAGYESERAILHHLRLPRALAAVIAGVGLSLSLSGMLLQSVIAQDTPLLLLDEPTAHLDAATRRDLLLPVFNLVREEGKTVLIVLHDVNDALRLGDHIARMEDGRLTFYGTKEDFLAQKFPERHFGLSAVATDGTLSFFY